MKILLLPGQNINNKGWIEKIASAIRNDFDDIYVASYQHWEVGELRADIELEKNKVVDFAQTWEGQDYIVFGKSLGSVIALKAVYENLIKPRAMYFVGIPYAFAKERNQDIDTWLKSITTPVLIEQKENDPMSPFKALKDDIDNPKIKVEKYERTSEPNNDHHYADIDYLKAKIIEISNES